MSQFTWYSDPGHAWLEVPKPLVDGLELPISRFSYTDGKKVYLEEDCDAGRFLKAYNAPYKTIHTACLSPCFIRNLDQYQRSAMT